ncbi:unnamed protein product, partial [Nesidiocoris tenuis]
MIHGSELRNHVKTNRIPVGQAFENHDVLQKRPNPLFHEFHSRPSPNPREMQNLVKQGLQASHLTPRGPEVSSGSRAAAGSRGPQSKSEQESKTLRSPTGYTHPLFSMSRRGQLSLTRPICPAWRKRTIFQNKLPMYMMEGATGAQRGFPRARGPRSSGPPPLVTPLLLHRQVPPPPPPEVPSLSSSVVWNSDSSERSSCPPLHPGVISFARHPRRSPGKSFRKIHPTKISYLTIKNFACLNETSGIETSRPYLNFSRSHSDSAEIPEGQVCEASKKDVLHLLPQLTISSWRSAKVVVEVERPPSDRVPLNRAPPGTSRVPLNRAPPGTSLSLTRAFTVWGLVRDNRA